jgi:hypothetical protein
VGNSVLWIRSKNSYDRDPEVGKILRLIASINGREPERLIGAFLRGKKAIQGLATADFGICLLFIETLGLV